MSMNFSTYLYFKIRMMKDIYQFIRVTKKLFNNIFRSKNIISQIPDSADNICKLKITASSSLLIIEIITNRTETNQIYSVPILAYNSPSSDSSIRHKYKNSTYKKSFRLVFKKPEPSNYSHLTKRHKLRNKLES